MRAIASFLAYVQRSIAPDVKSPSLADAIMGLRVGKAFRDLGAKTGREAIRALPMAVADLVQEVFESEAVRGPLATRGVLYTGDGRVGHRARAQVLLNDSAGTDGGAAGTAVFARGGTGRAGRARWPQAATALGVRDPHRRRGGRDPHEGLDGDRGARSPTGPRSTRRSSCRPPTRNAPRALCDPVALGPTTVWRTENIRQPGATARMQLRARRSAGVPRR